MTVRMMLFLCWIPLFSGCTPVFNPKTTHLFSHISIERIDDRMGQVLRNCLKKTLITQNPLYTLTIVLSEHNHPLILNRQGQSSINHYILKAEYTLCRRRDRCVIGKKTIRVYGVKPMTVSYYSQTVMDQTTQTRAIKSLADKILHAIAMDLNKAPQCTCPILKPPSRHESYTPLI